VASRPLWTAAAHRGWRSSVAIRPCCVDTDSGCGVPGVFPFDGSTSRLSPSLPWVLRGGVSQVQQYYETLRLPRTQTGRLMDSSLGSSPSPRLRSVRYEDASCRLAPGLRSDAVRPWFSAGNTGTSQSLPPRRRGFLGCPFCAFALLFDPGRTSAPHRLGASVLPPYPIRRRLPRVNNFGAPAHGFGTGCLRFMAGLAAGAHARLACGGW